MDLAADGKIDAVPLAEMHHTADGFDSLGNHVHFVEDVLQRTTLAELFADITVAALLRYARGDEVTEAREAGEGCCLAAHCLAQARQFRQPARDHC